MDKLAPRGAVLPRIGQQVSILVGEPILLDDLFQARHALGWTDDQLYLAISSRIGRTLQQLKAQLDGVEVTVDDALEPINTESLLPLIGRAWALVDVAAVLQCIHLHLHGGVAFQQHKLNCLFTQPLWSFTLAT
jgi:hypothetical protein